MLNHALNYASLGLYVIPLNTPVGGGCSCGNLDCKSIGKHPRTSNGLKDASADPATIRQWWTKWPTANIGIVTGAKSGIVVVDADNRHAGDESLAALEQEHGPLRLVPFNQRYWSRSKGETGPAKLEADLQLAEKLKAEYPGILSWLVVGCLAWQSEGLGVPPEVNEATENYRKSEDSLTAFIDACCEMKPDATANVSAVAESYRDFSGDNITSSKLTKLLTGRGFIKQKSTDKETKGQWQWHGFSLSA